MLRGRPSRAAIHERLAFEMRELRERYGGLPRPEDAEHIWTDIWQFEAHNSTALEGNTLVLREVELLLTQGRAVGNKELKDYLEVQGYASAAKWVYAQAHGRGEWLSGQLLTITEVRQVHRLAMTPVWEVAPHPQALDTESPGNFRQHDIQAFAAGMRPPDFTQVPARVTDWLAAVNGIDSSSRPMAVAVAEGHAAFERIHPFLDGNGRAGRLLMNLLLVRLGYPPAIIQQRERRRYLDALDAADSGDPDPLGELIARGVLDNLTRFVVPAVAGPTRLVPLASLVGPEITLVAMRAAAERGRLRAYRGTDGLWRSSRLWVDQYLVQRHRRLRTAD
ncbi:MAG TPA: Fic family protein [Chloroflexota bacterium]|jgi:Fic family protein|nr:Fic family protein [Chloroflexota bacterium]